MTKQSACSVAALCSVVALLACGSTGPQGPAGPPARSVQAVLQRQRRYLGRHAFDADSLLQLEGGPTVDGKLWRETFRRGSTSSKTSRSPGVIPAPQPAGSALGRRTNAVPVGASGSAEICCYNMGGT